MVIYWRLQDMPELKPLSKAERTEVWVTTAAKRFRDPVMLLMLIPLFLIVALGNYLGGQLLPWRFGSAIGGGLGAGFAVVLWEVVALNRCRLYVTNELRRRSQK